MGEILVYYILSADLQWAQTVRTSLLLSDAIAIFSGKWVSEVKLVPVFNYPGVIILKVCEEKFAQKNTYQKNLTTADKFSMFELHMQVP